MPQFIVNLLSPKPTLHFSSNMLLEGVEGKHFVEKINHRFEILAISKPTDGSTRIFAYNGIHTKVPDTLEELIGVADTSLKRQGPKFFFGIVSPDHSEAETKVSPYLVSLFPESLKFSIESGIISSEDIEFSGSLSLWVEQFNSRFSSLIVENAYSIEDLFVKLQESSSYPTTSELACVGAIEATVEYEN